MGYISKQSSLMNDEMLRAMVEDAVRLCDKYSSPRFIGFFDERQCAAASDILNRLKVANSMFYGGFKEAERRMLGIFPNYVQPDNSTFPIITLGFKYRQNTKLCHRDFLGSIISCGVKREKVGDILCGNGTTVAFINRDIAAFLELNIHRVGGEGVNLQLDYQGELPAEHSFREIHGTVASPRLDSVVKAATGLSREGAARLIKAGRVSVNHVIIFSVSDILNEKDVVSIRGKGRYKVHLIGPKTRKDRLFITLKKYENTVP